MEQLAQWGLKGYKERLVPKVLQATKAPKVLSVPSGHKVLKGCKERQARKDRKESAALLD
jgi:hypothetical protein